MAAYLVVVCDIIHDGHGNGLLLVLDAGCELPPCPRRLELLVLLARVMPGRRTFDQTEAKRGSDCEQQRYSGETAAGHLPLARLSCFKLAGTRHACCRALMLLLE